jgi:nicotinamidase-related amidase
MTRPDSRPRYGTVANTMLLVKRGQPGADEVDLLKEALMNFTLKDKPNAFRFLDLSDELKDSVLDHVRFCTS